MQNTRDRDSFALAMGLKWVSRAKVLVLMLLALLLVACGADKGGKEERATTVVSTVASPTETATAVPTDAPPTATPMPTFTPTPPAPLAALVNGQYVFLADYERQVAQYEQALRELGQDLDTEEGQARLAEARQRVLESMIDDVLIEQVAPELGVTLGEDELAAQMVDDMASGGGEVAFGEWLQANGLTADDYERMLRQALLVQRVWDVVTADVQEEAEQVHIRHIVVDSEEAAGQVLSQLQNGADFVTLAREQSLDSVTKESGGDLGWFPRGVIAPELESAAFALQPGEVSEIIPMGEQFYIIQVVEREAVRPLEPELLLHLKQDRFDQWLAELLAKADIERFVGE